MVLGLGRKAVRVIGVIVVLLSVFMAWIVITFFGGTISLNLLDMLQPGPSPSPTEMLLQQLSIITLLLMAVGVLVAILAPRRSGVGGLIVILSAVAFAVGVEVYASDAFKAASDYGVGFYVAIIGGAILAFQLIMEKA